GAAENATHVAIAVAKVTFTELLLEAVLDRSPDAGRVLFIQAHTAAVMLAQPAGARVIVSLPDRETSYSAPVVLILRRSDMRRNYSTNFTSDTTSLRSSPGVK